MRNNETIHNRSNRVGDNTNGGSYGLGIGLRNIYFISSLIMIYALSCTVMIYAIAMKLNTIITLLGGMK